jgi:hypothetical protein
MDHFEGLVSMLLEAEGYWVRRSYAVNLSKEAKKETGKPSIPRPEIDILAFHAKSNILIALEVKSLLDSPGVRLADLQLEHELAEGRFKLFTTATYRRIVLDALRAELIGAGMINDQTEVRLGLACGNIHKGLSNEVRNYLGGRGIFFWSPEDIKGRLTALADADYKNDAATMVAKMLLR